MTGLLWPVQGPMTSPYGHRSGVNPLQHNDFHTGVDFGVPIGTPIYATHSGYFSSFNNYGGGLVLRVGGVEGWETRYAHTSRAAVAAGTYVRQGQLIGYTGRSGAAVTGPHLHYEVLRHGKHLDPRYTMPMAGPDTMAWAKSGFNYDADTAARQQAKQLADIKRAAAEQEKFEVDRSRGILGEFAEISRSQRTPKRYGIDTVSAASRAPKQMGRASRPSRFAVE